MCRWAAILLVLGGLTPASSAAQPPAPGCREVAWEPPRPPQSRARTRYQDELTLTILGVIRSGAQHAAGFYYSGADSVLTALWRGDSAAVERSLAELVVTDYVTNRTEAAIAADVYADLSGRFTPLALEWRVWGWGRWSEILRATTRVDDPAYYPLIRGMACAAAWHLLAWHRDAELWEEPTRLLWPPAVPMGQALQFAWPLLRPEDRATIRRDYLQKVPFTLHALE
ncbi:MAG TPA: hypothetical protein VJ773_05615 [Gemmatimonadales bacterium]|nr:hypothetical protein [Gemmatimonadales bacterium]